MYNPIFIQFLHNLKTSPSCAPKSSIAPLVGRLVAISPVAANVEKFGVQDPAGWLGVSVMCAAQVPRLFYFDLSTLTYAVNAILFLHFIVRFT